MSTAPKKQTQKSSSKPLTKNQRKKLKKKLKRQQEKEKEKEKEAMEAGSEDRTEVTENGEKFPVSSPMTTDSCSESIALENSGTLTSESIPVVVNGGNESPTAMGHATSEVEGLPSVEGEESDSEASDGDGDGEREGGERTEEEELNARRWGPLKGPVEVKIADLGNACWVVSGFHNI